jgi:hypothetical protein
MWTPTAATNITDTKDRGGQRRGAAERQQSASQFDETSDEGMAAARKKADCGKPLTGGFQTEPTKPPEQLLCPMCGERQADGDSQQEKTCRHVQLQPSCRQVPLVGSGTCAQSRAPRARPHPPGRIDAVLTTVASSMKVRFYGAAGVTRVQSSLNSTLSKNANALTILSSRIVRNQAYVFAYGFPSRHRRTRFGSPVARARTSGR